MTIILSALVSPLSFRFRGRASLELELIALRHQVTVLRRQRPGRPKLFRADRLLWVWLYRIWPQALHVMGLVKPATVIQWHRKGFRTLLAMEIRIRPSGTAQDAQGDPRSDPQNKHRQSAVGCAPDPRRAVQARYRSEPSHRRQIHARATRSPVPDLA